MIDRPYVIGRCALTLDARVLDWDLPIPRRALGASSTTAKAVARESADIVLTGADTLWPMPPRWPPVPGTPASGPATDDEELLTDNVVPLAADARAYAITDSRARLPREFFDHNLGTGSNAAWPGGPTRPSDEPRLAPIMLVTRATPLPPPPYLRSRGIAYLVRGEGGVDLRAALDALAQNFGVTRVLADGGAQLPAALLRARLLVEIVLHYFPVVLGQAGMTAFQASHESALSEPVVMALSSLDSDGRGGIVARYRIDEAS